MAPVGVTPYVKCEGGVIVSSTPKFDYVERGRGVLIDKHPNTLSSSYFSNAQIAMNPAETMAYVLDGNFALFSLNPVTGVYTQMVSRANTPWIWASALLVSLDGTVLWLSDPYAYGMFKITLAGTVIANQAVPAGNFMPRAGRMVWNTAGTIMYVCIGALRPDALTPAP